MQGGEGHDVHGVKETGLEEPDRPTVDDFLLGFGGRPERLSERVGLQMMPDDVFGEIVGESDAGCPASREVREVSERVLGEIVSHAGVDAGVLRWRRREEDRNEREIVAGRVDQFIVFQVLGELELASATTQIFLSDGGFIAIDTPVEEATGQDERVDVEEVAFRQDLNQNAGRQSLPEGVIIAGGRGSDSSEQRETKGEMVAKTYRVGLRERETELRAL